MKTFTALFIVAVSATAAHADDINLASLDEEPNRVHVTTGAEYGFVAGVGYSRILPFLDRQIVVSADATLPWASFDLSDYRVRAGALIPIVGTERLKLAGSIAPLVRGTKLALSTMTDVGADFALVGGFYTRRWFVAGELGVDVALSTHVSHTDEYRMSTNPDAMDGWYADAGANLRAGIQAGVALDRYDLSLRLGQVRDVNGEAPLLPFYGTLTVDARW